MAEALFFQPIFGWSSRLFVLFCLFVWFFVVVFFCGADNQVISGYSLSG